MLVHKLAVFGVANNTISRFKSYLHARRQCVRYNDMLSDLEWVPYHVPLGGAEMSTICSTWTVGSKLYHSPSLTHKTNYMITMLKWK
jgi:hypothetical protein